MYKNIRKHNRSCLENLVLVLEVGEVGSLGMINHEKTSFMSQWRWLYVASPSSTPLLCQRGFNKRRKNKGSMSWQKYVFTVTWLMCKLVIALPIMQRRSRLEEGWCCALLYLCVHMTAFRCIFLASHCWCNELPCIGGQHCCFSPTTSLSIAMTNLLGNHFPCLLGVLSTCWQLEFSCKWRFLPVLNHMVKWPTSNRRLLFLHF